MVGRGARLSDKETDWRTDTHTRTDKLGRFYEPQRMIFFYSVMMMSALILDFKKEERER